MVKWNEEGELEHLVATSGNLASGRLSRQRAKPGAWVDVSNSSAIGG